MEKVSTRSPIITFLGPPGSGKGTVAQQAYAELGFQILSTGNVCRQHIAEQTEFGKKLEKYLSVGKLIPDKLVIQMVSEWLDGAILQQTGIVLDGFPRTKEQAKAFLSLLSAEFSGYPFGVIEFSISDDEILQRLRNRIVCENKACQRVYSDTLPPRKQGICDTCGAKLNKRFDDDISIVKERLKVYAAYKNEILHYYASQNVPVFPLQVNGLNPEEVFAKFKALLKAFQESC